MTTTVAARFALDVPPGWARVPVGDAPAAERAVRSLARRLTWSRPDRERVQPLVAELFTGAVAARTSPTTVEVHLALGREPTRPLVCALTVDLVPAPRTADPLAVRAAFLSTAGAGGSAEVPALSCGPVPRTVRRRSGALPDGTALDSGVVQYLHADAGGGFALLSFATPQVRQLDPLCRLFDTVAGSFRWLP